MTFVFNVKSIATLTFDPWPCKSIGSISLHGKYLWKVWCFCDDSFVFYPAHKVFNVFHCDPDIWPLTLKINRVHPLSMGNNCGRFDAYAMIALSSILFTRFRTHTHTSTLTHTRTHGSDAISSSQLCWEGIIKDCFSLLYA